MMRKGPGEEKLELFSIQGLGFRDTGYIGIMENENGNYYNGVK